MQILGSNSKGDETVIKTEAKSWTEPVAISVAQHFVDEAARLDALHTQIGMRILSWSIIDYDVAFVSLVRPTISS